MDEFIKIANSSELIDSKGIVRKLEDDEIALVKLDGYVSAFINVCPHQHTRLVDKCGGQISGENLTCPMHGWTFHLKTGICVDVTLSGSAARSPAMTGDPKSCGDNGCDISHLNDVSVMSGKGGKLKMLEVKIQDGSVFVRRIIRNPVW